MYLCVRTLSTILIFDFGISTTVLFFWFFNLFILVKPALKVYCVSTPLSAIFQLYHGVQLKWLKKPEHPKRTTDHEQATGKLYHLWLRVECTLFVNLQSRARTHYLKEYLYITKHCL